MERKELGKADPGNWVTYFGGAQFRKSLGTNVLLVSPTGEHLKHIVQLAFPWDGCANSMAECEGLLAGLRIAVGLGMTHLAIRGDSQLIAGQAEKAGMIPLTEA
jgi:ribonuclease HI